MFCGGQGKLRSSEECILRVIDSAKKRKEINDRGSISLIEKILSSSDEECEQFRYHHLCYSSFTDKGKVERIEKKLTAANAEENDQTKRKHSRREHAIDWNLCMFC